MASTVSSRGQTVIPSKLRKKYKIKANSKVEWIDTGNGLALIPIPKDVIASSRGILKGVSTQSLLESRKEDLELEDKNK